MKPWMKYGSAAAILALLAACNSGIQDPVESALDTQATGSVTKRVAASTDDAEETPELSGKMVLNGSDLELGFGDDTRPAAVGLRFTGITVPRGAEITSARIKFTARATSSGSASLTFHGVDQDNTSTFSTAAYNVSNRAKTSTSVAWSAPAWTQGEVGADTTSPDLKAVVQEVVSRTGWASGNALAVVVTGTGTGQRSAWATDFGSSTAPELVVNYSTTTTEPPPPPPPPSGDPEIAAWQSRLEAALNKPDKVHYDPKKMAASNDLYIYARNLNDALTSFTATYRITKDQDTVRYMRDTLAIMRSKLADTNGDGYKNWIYLSSQDSISACRTKLSKAPDSDPKYCGNDIHHMDEMMTHASVAAAVYTLQQAGFTSDVAFWKDYLENHFEAKWRTRTSSGYPDHKLMHPTAQFARYHFYMYKLTGKSEYYTEAKRLAGLVRGTMRASGDGYIWAHHRSEMSGCQPTVYLHYTMAAMADLAVVDSGLYSSSFMAKIANTVADRLIRTSDGHSIVGNICTNQGVYDNYWAFSKHPYAIAAPWDASGKIERTLRETFKATYEGYYIVPSMMIHSLGR